MKTLLSAILIMFATTAFSAVYKVDEVRVYKSKHRMDMLFEGKVTRTYTVMLGRGGMAPKRQEGDKLVPEGEYLLDVKNPYSSFFKSIHINYPNQDDIDRANALGVNPGYDIFIHGLPKLLRKKGDWTAGCIAVQNWEMQEIWDNLEVPTPIKIYR